MQEAVALERQLEEQQDVPGHPNWQELPVQLPEPYLQWLQGIGHWHRLLPELLGSIWSRDVSWALLSWAGLECIK